MSSFWDRPLNPSLLRVYLYRLHASACSFFCAMACSRSVQVLGPRKPAEGECALRGRPRDHGVLGHVIAAH
jgi:hypothetical protein